MIETKEMTIWSWQGQDFFSPPPQPSFDSGALPASCLMGTGVSFLMDKVAGTKSCPLTIESRICGALPLLPHTSL